MTDLLNIAEWLCYKVFGFKLWLCHFRYVHMNKLVNFSNFQPSLSIKVNTLICVKMVSGGTNEMIDI